MKKLLLAIIICLSLTACGTIELTEITQEYIYYFAETSTEFTVDGKSKDYFSYSVYVDYTFQFVAEDSFGSFGPFGLGEPETGIIGVSPRCALLNQPSKITLKRVIDNVEFILDFSEFKFDEKTRGNAGIGWAKVNDIDLLIENYDSSFVKNFVSYDVSPSPDKLFIKKEGERVTNICIDVDKLFARIDSIPNESNTITIGLPKTP